MILTYVSTNILLAPPLPIQDIVYTNLTSDLKDDSHHSFFNSSTVTHIIWYISIFYAPFQEIKAFRHKCKVKKMLRY